MSKHADYVRAIVDENKVDMDELLEIEDKAWDALKSVDQDSYCKLMDELEALRYRMTRSDAVELVRNMKPYGEYWNYETIEQFLNDKGITEDVLKFYVTMNMAKNDYNDTAKRYDLENDPDFFFGIADDFLNDEDAKANKFEKYFCK